MMAWVSEQLDIVSSSTERLPFFCLGYSYLKNALDMLVKNSYLQNQKSVNIQVNAHYPLA